MPPLTKDELDAALKECGITAVVYSFPWPETLSVVEAGLAKGVGPLIDESWEQRQESIPGEFFDTFLSWVRPAIGDDAAAGYPYHYPTAGSSEGLREIVHDLAVRTKGNGRLHCFEGEYAGPSHYAKAAGITLVVHPRPSWRKVPEKMTQGDLFYLSQPSAIDGSTWKSYESMMDLLSQAGHGAIVDLAYIGAVPAVDLHVYLHHKAIRAVAFSLSKCYGVYYLRVGGLLSRHPLVGLEGNKYFINAPCMKVGIDLMKSIPFGAIPAAYKAVQAQAAKMAEDRMAVGRIIQPADVLWLATCAPQPHHPLAPMLTRGALGEERMRICLAPLLHKLVYGSSATVRPRQTEYHGPVS